MVLGATRCNTILVLRAARCNTIMVQHHHDDGVASCIGRADARARAFGALNLVLVSQLINSDACRAQHLP